MKKLLIVVLLCLAGCATQSTIVEEKYLVIVPDDELITPPQAERDKLLKNQLDPEKATDQDLAKRIFDMQNYINAMERQQAKLRKWYDDRIDLLKKNLNLKDSDIQRVN